MGRIERLAISPGGGLSGRFRPPGDKSITHRAYLLGALAAGRSVVRGANPGADCAATLDAIRLLGARVESGAEAVAIEGTACGLRESGAVIDCGNSGTSLRLLAGAVAGHAFLTVLTGDESLRARPVDRVIEPLTRMGATLRARNGNRHPPLVIEGAALAGVRFETATASAQVASAILLAALHAQGRTDVVQAQGVRDHTMRMLHAFGVEVGSEPAGQGATRFSLVGPAIPSAATLTVPGDFSAAAFFLAAAAATPGATVMAEQVNLNPTRTGLLRVLEEMGARIELRAQRDEAGEPIGDIVVTGPTSLAAFDVPAEWVPSMVDEIPAWAIVASAARGTSRLAGAGELRIKESDRLESIGRNLAALGVAVDERPDGIAITGGAVQGGVVEARHDHRIAMAFALLGTRARGVVTIDDAASISTSFPGFRQTLVALGGHIQP